MKKLNQSNDNVIYCVPTSGGKTLVAELMIMREVIQRCPNGSDVLMVLPYVAIVQEKVRDLQPFAQKFGFIIEEHAGAKGKTPLSKRLNFR